MIPVVELEKSGDARFGNSDSRLGTYEKNFGSRTGYMQFVWLISMLLFSFDDGQECMFHEELFDD